MTDAALETPRQDGGESTVPCLALRTKDAARALGIGERLLWSLTNQGIIPHVKLNKATLYPVHLLREWLTQQAKGGDHQ